MLLYNWKAISKYIFSLSFQVQYFSRHANINVVKSKNLKRFLHYWFLQFIVKEALIQSCQRFFYTRWFYGLHFCKQWTLNRVSKLRVSQHLNFLEKKSLLEPFYVMNTSKHAMWIIFLHFQIISQERKWSGKVCSFEFSRKYEEKRASKTVRTFPKT